MIVRISVWNPQVNTGFPFFNLLEDEINITIANPKWVKATKGNKDDTKDSKWLGDLFRLGLVRGSYVPYKKIHILRGYTRYYYNLVLTVCLEQSGKSINHKEIASKLLKRFQAKEDAAIESIEGYQMTDASKHRMRLIRTHMDYITAEIKDIYSMIESLVSSDPDYENASHLLCTILGIKHDSVMTIISVCPDYRCRCLPQPYIGTVRSCSHKILQISLLQKEV